MNAQYYYLDPDGQTVRGPFGLQDIWALHERKSLERHTLICRPGFGDWQTLESFPELLPPPRPEIVAAPPPPVVVPPEPSTPGGPVHSLRLALAAGTVLLGTVICYFSVVEKNNVADAGSLDLTVPPATVPDHSWDDGYGQGIDVGAATSRRGLPVPSAADLRADATLVCRTRAHPLKEDLWIEGYEEGFAAGYKEVAKPAAAGR